MKHPGLMVICWIILGLSTALAQSGRRSTKPPTTPPPPVIDDPKERPANTPVRDRPEVVAVPNEEYKCVDDGSLTVVVASSEAEKVFVPNEVTVSQLLSRPKPEYTSEARRRVEGAIAVRVVVLKNGTVSTVGITGRWAIWFERECDSCGLQDGICTCLKGWRASRAMVQDRYSLPA